MATFPIREEEYSVKEISYEEMMLQLDLQKLNACKTKGSIFNQQHPTANRGSVRPLSRQDFLLRRLSENANRQLPAWLLNIS